MKMSDELQQDKMLDALFEAAKAQELPPSEGLMARIQADAHAEQPRPMAVRAATSSLLNALWRAIGGWPAMAGLATATFAGGWIGIYPTDYVADIMAQYTGSDSELYLIDSMSAYEFDLGEG